MASRDHATLELYRAKDSRLHYVNRDLLRQDIPGLSQASDAEVDAWVSKNLTYVSAHINDNAGIQHSGVAVDRNDQSHSFVFHTYGRADVKGEDYVVDRKGVGVTYVTKDESGAIRIVPGRVTFKAGADHQNGVASVGEAVYEAIAGEILEIAAGDKTRGTGANQVYAILKTGGEMYNFDSNQHRTGSDPMALINRQPNIRFYRLSAEDVKKAQDSFLFSNARLFWTGLYHGSMNRYNADNGIYLDYGTVTGVPNHAYRMTSMSHVPYGLSDFYGLFGEWSAGQVRGKDGKNESPFYERSWGVFLANLGVAAGMNKDATVRFVRQNEKSLGTTDLHEHLLKLNSGRPDTFRLDPTRKTYTKMDLVTITGTGIAGTEKLENKTDSIEIYKKILHHISEGTQGSAIEYADLIRRMTSEPDPQAVMPLAEGFLRAEMLLRKVLPNGVQPDHSELLGRDRVGAQMTRERMFRDSFTAGDNVSATVDRYRTRVRSAQVARELREKKPTAHEPEKLQRFVEAFARNGDHDASIVHIKSDAVDREIPFVVATPETLNSPEYEHIRENTMGLLWRDTRPAGEQFGHSYVRVGNKIYDLQVHKIFSDDFTRMMGNRFFYNFAMRDHGGNSPYHEVLFPLTPESRDELQRFFEDRSQGRATIGGSVVVPHFNVSGKGEPWNDGVIRENCGAFATCFNKQRWWHDYPYLENVVHETGLKYPKDGATVALEALFDPNTKPIGVISWGEARNTENPDKAHYFIGFQNVRHHSDVLQTWRRGGKRTDWELEADQTRKWAEKEGLWGVQATSHPTVQKEGGLTRRSERFNIIRLENKALDSFENTLAKRSVIFWWRWEPGGQFGHAWVSVGDRLYDQAAGGYYAQNLKEFLNREHSNHYRLGGTETFFTGLQVEMDPKDIKVLQTFFEARVSGKKQDGTALPQPAYRWDAPFVKDAITEGRCGMFATSAANSEWQKLFPELPLAEISEKYGLKYNDGSLFLLHKGFQSMKGPKNLIWIGADKHMTKDLDWNLPTDSLPKNVKEASKSGWRISEREAFGN